MGKKIKLWQYMAICLVTAFIEGFFVFPEVFQTSVPVLSVDFLPRLGIYIVWQMVQAALGYFMTRG
jgi:hypothetical protein